MRIRSAVAVLVLVSAGVALPATVAQAAPGDCRTSVTYLVDRPDGGHGDDNGGVWARDTFTRTVKICEVQPDVVVETPVDRAWYQATAVDTGTFTTITGEHLSPRAGVALLGGMTGTITGGFTTVKFDAEANFLSYNAKHDKQTYTGKPGGDNPATSQWVNTLFTEDVKANLDSYGWTYKTCTEQWVETSDNDDGQAEDAGDITGKPCPSVEPVPPAVPSEPAASLPSDEVGLPVTGADVQTIGMAGGVLLVVGAVLLFAVRRRRRFTA